MARKTPSREPEGVAIDLISKRMLQNMTAQEKIRFILDEVKKAKILVLEAGLDPVEEAKLIEQTMGEIDQETFIGIEMQSQRMPEEKGNFASKFLRRTGMAARSMTVVGPADKLRTIHKDGQTIHAMILAGKEAPA